MAIIKKVGKFIASRALYFALGVLIAIGTTYAYATWDQARTGGSGELSEANWNELVTMIKSEIGGACYVSYIDDPTDAACVVGFTNMGSAGMWGYCWKDSPYALFRPPGGGCHAAQFSYDLGEAFVCCQ